MLQPEEVRAQIQLVSLLSSGIINVLPPEVAKIAKKIQKCLLYDKTSDVICFSINTFKEKDI